MGCPDCRHRKARRTCACCHRATCTACAEEIGGLTHCPACAGLAREFINSAPLELEALDAPAEMPSHGQKQLSRGA